MRKMNGTKMPVRALERHVYICDLLYSDGPIVSLFRDRRFNWIYLWVDTDQVGTDRWFLFPVSRGHLVGYLKKEATLQSLLLSSWQRWMLDTKVRIQDGGTEVESSSRGSNRTLRDITNIEIPDDYCPANDSFFDEMLSSDISLGRELGPVSFDVPIDGYWFFSDLDRFSGLYGQLYSFFYCAKPQLIANLGQRIKRFLRSPWEGGFSRVNLFRALQDFVPSLHDLEIKSIQYASPGEIRIEALPSVAERIASTLGGFINNEVDIVEAEKAINSFLSSGEFKRRNVSNLSDEHLGLTQENLSFLHSKIDLICNALGVVNEMGEISSHSPNIIVSAKVVVALLGRIRRLAEFQRNGQINLI